jgi:thioesterase domain-containing protein/Flp pilus assembly protein TadD/acyl carrier protein
VVIAKDNNLGDRFLVAYIVPDPKQKPNLEQIRLFLKDRLPNYMIPKFFSYLSTLPLTINGKIDIQFLANLKLDVEELQQTYVAPRIQIELWLKQIWERLLPIQTIGIKDNFFDLGGHSLLAVKLFAEITKKFKKQIPLSILFQYPTIEELANFLENPDFIPCHSSLVPIQTHGSKPPLFLIHPIGGEVLVYQSLAFNFDLDQPIYGLKAKGLDGIIEPHHKVEDMAADYIQEILQLEPQSQYFLGGYSSGGRIAFEMARQLTQQGRKVGILIFIDSGIPDLWHNKLPSNSQSIGSEYQKKLIDDNLNAMKIYRPSTYFCKTILFECQWRVFSRENIGYIINDSGRQKVLSQFVIGSIELETVPGEHNDMLNKTNIKKIAKKIQKNIDKILTKDNDICIDETIDFYKKAIAINPERPCLVYEHLGYLLLQKKDLQGSIVNYRKFIEVHYFYFYKKIADIFYYDKKLDLAFYFYHKAIKIRPNNPEIYHSIGQYQIKKNNFFLAICAYLKAIELDPENYFFYFCLGNSYLHKKYFDRAINSYNRAIELNHNYFDAYKNLGRVFEKINRPELALAAYKKCLHIRPKYLDIYCLLGMLSLNYRDPSNALIYFDRAIELNLNCVRAYQGKAKALISQGKLESALIVYQEILKFQPYNANIYANLSDYYSQINDLEKSHI